MWYCRKTLWYLGAVIVDSMVDYIKLLRLQRLGKTFSCSYLLFAGKLLTPSVFLISSGCWIGGFAFSFLASSIYIINDYRDVEDDRKYPTKMQNVRWPQERWKSVGLAISGQVDDCRLVAELPVDPGFKFLLLLDLFSLNIGIAALGLKPVNCWYHYCIRWPLCCVKGRCIGRSGKRVTLIIMTFLLKCCLWPLLNVVMMWCWSFLTGTDMRKAIKGYSLEFQYSGWDWICAILIVAYINYALHPALYKQFGHRLYYTALFVIAGIMLPADHICIGIKAGSPPRSFTKRPFYPGDFYYYGCWVYFILYMKDITVLTDRLFL